MTPRSLTGLIAALFFLIAALDAYFIINETERAVLKRFQEIVRTDIQPGIHWKVPFVDKVLKVDGRAIAFELPPQSYLTSERKLMDVSSFVIWRVADVQRYVTVIGGGGINTSDRMRDIAQQRLTARVAESLRNGVAQKTVQEVVAGRRELIADPDAAVEPVQNESALPVISAEEAQLDPQEDAREQLMVNVLEEIKQPALQDFGIDVVDVRVKQVDWPDEVRGRVFDRMRAERARDAARHRSEGREGAERIRAAAERERTVLLADAFRKAQLIKGDGDAKAAAVYSEIYSRDQEFYRFHRSLQSYRESFSGPEDILVLSPEGDFFRYLKSQDGQR